jgi:hypothetical protein
MRLPPQILTTIAALGAFSACKSEEAAGICTASFAFVPVTVRDSSDNPVTGLSIVDTVIRTQHNFVVPQSLGLPAGTYVILDDSFRSQIRLSGESVQVSGFNGATGFTATFTFDAPGGCHVRKVSGPDSVIVP